MNRYGCIFMRDVSMRQRTVTVKARTLKNEAIKNKLKATREKHSLMRPIVIELKLDLNALIGKKTCYRDVFRRGENG